MPGRYLTSNLCSAMSGQAPDNMLTGIHTHACLLLTPESLYLMHSSMHNFFGHYHYTGPSSSHWATMTHISCATASRPQDDCRQLCRC